MTPAGPTILVAFASILIAAQASPTDRVAEIHRAVFDLCPKVFAGTLSLDDPAQLAAIGYKGTPPRDTPGGKIPRADTGEGAMKVVIAGHGGAKPSCSIWFGGPDNKERIGEVLTDAGKVGYKVGPPQFLGDNTLILKVARKTGSPKTFAMIGADAGGEFGGNPASTIIYLD